MNIPKQVRPVIRGNRALAASRGTAGGALIQPSAADWTCRDIDSRTLKCHKTGKWIVAHKLQHGAGTGWTCRDIDSHTLACHNGGGPIHADKLEHHDHVAS